MQGHKHTDSGHGHTYSAAVNSGAFYYPGSQYLGALWQDLTTDNGYANLGLPTKYNDEYGEPRNATETRSKNITVRYWKRTA